MHHAKKFDSCQPAQYAQADLSRSFLLVVISLISCACIILTYVLGLLDSSGKTNTGVENLNLNNAI